MAYNKAKWWLFIDASKDSIKVVLIHNGNTLSCLPIAYSTTMKKSYENLKAFLTSIQYDDHNQHICAYFNVVVMLTGFQLGYTKFCCFLCLWNSRARVEHYVRKNCPIWDEIAQGKNNIKHKPLVKGDIIFWPILHIKLGLFIQFVKALDKETTGFACLAEKFPSLSQVKIKEVILIGPQIREVVLDETFITHLKKKEKLVFEPFKKVCGNLLSNHLS